MRTYPPCIQCITDVRLRDIRSAAADPDEAIEKQLELLSVIRNEFVRGGELTMIASRIFYRLTKIMPEVVEHYRIIKRRAIDDSWKMISKYKKLIEGLDGYDKFRLAVKISIAGNAMDTGVAGHEPPKEISEETILSTPITVDHTREIYNLLKEGGHRILWLFDNAGEAVLDTILIGIIREMGNKVVGAAKEDPGFQNDLTISDAEYAGLDKYLDKLISTGYMGSSIHLNRVSNDLLKELKEADIVIAKGMAHFEYLHEIDLGKPTVFLLMPKCDIIALVSGGKKGTYVALLSKPRK
ncbi:DUF89 family protein [Desulfurococcaceae archaeon MEX13E-LK6-19]|nr:DUF89 family protein [Desulfurococcaceae archaeon MEX13E-LK6-19]